MITKILNKQQKLAKIDKLAKIGKNLQKLNKIK